MVLQSLTAYVDRDTQSSVVVDKKTDHNGIKTRRYVGTHYIITIAISVIIVSITIISIIIVVIIIISILYRK